MVEAGGDATTDKHDTKDTEREYNKKEPQTRRMFQQQQPASATPYVQSKRVRQGARDVDLAQTSPNSGRGFVGSLFILYVFDTCAHYIAYRKNVYCKLV